MVDFHAQVENDIQASVAGCGYTVEAVLEDGGYEARVTYVPTGEMFVFSVGSLMDAEACIDVAETIIYHMDLVHGISGKA